MLVYLTVAALLILLSAIKNRGAFYLAAVILLTFSALRSSNIGIDLPGYIEIFKHPAIAANKVEPGYLFLNYLLSLISDNEQFFILATTLLCNLPILYVVSKNSKHKTLSVLLYLLTGHYLFTFSGIRQSIAIALLFLAAHWLVNHQTFKATIGSLTALFIHISSGVFLPIFYLSGKWKISLKIAQSAILISFLLGFVINPTVFFKIPSSITIDHEIYNRLLNYQYYFTDVGVPLSRILIQTLPTSIIALLLLKNKNVLSSIYFRIFLWAVIINNLIISLPIGFRVPKAGLILMILLIPNYFDTIRNGKFYKFCVISFFVLTYAYNIYARAKTGYPNDIVPYSIGL